MVAITDDQGRRLGYDHGTFVNEIPNADFIEFDGAFYWTLPQWGIYSLETEGTGSTDDTLSFAIPLTSNLIQQTVYTGFGLPLDATAITTFSQATQDWRILVEGQADVLPTDNLQTTISSLIFVPMVTK
jgi:hypothetical protein